MQNPNNQKSQRNRKDNGKRPWYEQIRYKVKSYRKQDYSNYLFTRKSIFAYSPDSYCD